jgi:hypothetical protein
MFFFVLVLRYMCVIFSVLLPLFSYFSFNFLFGTYIYVCVCNMCI